MSFKIKKVLRKAVHKAKGFSLALLWIDIRYGVEEWFCLKTWKWRLKHTKRICLYSMAYYRPVGSGWDDVEVEDQWGLWLPIGFGLVSKANWDFDQKINRDIGQPEDEWKDFVDGGWPTYYYKDEFLTADHYFDAARKHLKHKTGDQAYDKDIELKLRVQSQKSLDDETKQWIDWVADGSKPMKVEFTDKAKEDMKELLGEDDAKKLFDDVEKRNKEIDNPEKQD